MKVDLTKKDLVNLVKGTSPYIDIISNPKLQALGSYNGSTGQWQWYYHFGKDLTEKELWDLYQFCLNSWKKENQFKVGETVIFMDKEVDIEEIFFDGTAKIDNPLWDFDEEGTAVENDEEYNEPFWIVVKLNELKKKCLSDRVSSN